MSEEGEEEEGLYSVRKAYRNPEFSQHGMSIEDLSSFKEEAHETSLAVKEGNKEAFNLVLDHWLKTFYDWTDDWVVKEDSKNLLFGLIFRSLNTIQSSIEYLEIKDFDKYIPEFINMLAKLLNYPEYVAMILGILTSFSTFDYISGDFQYEKYNFIEIMQEVFAEYKDPKIVTSGHLLLGNLVMDDAKIRDKVLESKFTEHIAFMLTQNKLKDSDINDLSYTIKWLIKQELRNLENLAYFECLLKPLDALLYSHNEDTINNALMARYRLTRHSDPKSEFFKDLWRKEIIDQILKISEQKDICTKNWFLVWWNFILAGKETVDYLLQREFWEILVDKSMDSMLDVEKEILSWITNLSLPNTEEFRGEELDDYFDKLETDSIFDCWSRYIKSGKTVLQIRAIRIFINVLLISSYQTVERIMEAGHMKIINDWINKNSASDTIFWALSAIDAFLQKDREDNKFKIHFQDELRGIDEIEKLQENWNNEIYEKITNILTEHYEGSPEDMI